MSNSEPRRNRSLRRLFQFSLRTYLIATVLGAVGLWCAMYWLREYWPQWSGSWGPPPTEVSLPGGWKVREHQRTVIDKDSGEKKTVREGRYELVDQHGYTRCVGWFHDDLASGWWTYYHDNGRRALQGECAEGCRTGVWTAWYENGYKQWEIAHGSPARLDDLEDLLEEDMAKATVTATQYVGHLNIGGGMPPDAEPAIISMRDGPSRTWWDNGQLQSTGTYRIDERDGQWTFWNRAGRRTESGRFEHGRRRGKWQEWNDAGDEETVLYADGLRIEKPAELEAKLKSALASNDRAAALELATIFGSVGGDAAEQLAPAIAHERDEEIVRCALTQAIRMGRDASKLSAELRDAERRWSGTTAKLAKIARASANDKLREPLLREVVVDMQNVAWEEETLIGDRLAEMGADCVPAVESLLSDKDPAVRRQAVAVLAQLNDAAYYSAGWPNLLTHRDDPHYRFFAATRQALQRASQHGDPEVAAAADRCLNPPAGQVMGGGFF